MKFFFYSVLWLVETWSCKVKPIKKLTSAIVEAEIN